MIYVAIGIDYKSKLVIAETSINSEVYQENISKSEMIEYMDSVRRKLGIHARWSKITHIMQHPNWLVTKCRYIQKWPANSPDLNPIEKMWGVMKQAVKKFKPTNVEELKIVIQKVWDDFPQEKINNLVISFYQRLHLIIQENGESI